MKLFIKNFLKIKLNQLDYRKNSQQIKLINRSINHTLDVLRSLEYFFIFFAGLIKFSKGIFSKGIFSKGIFPKGIFSKGIFLKGFFLMGFFSYFYQVEIQLEAEYAMRALEREREAARNALEKAKASTNIDVSIDSAIGTTHSEGRVTTTTEKSSTEARI